MKRDVWVSALVASIVSAGIAGAVTPAFNTIWNTSYEAIPADTEQESLGASRIRDLKQQLRLRLSQDHSWAGNGNDGYHKAVTLIQQTQNPAPSYDASATGGVLFTKQVGSTAELFYADNQNHTVQLTAAGSFNIPSSVPAGTVAHTAGGVPSGWLFADGSAVSRTTYAGLFTAIGTQYGAGNGSTTFNLPDCRARFIAGQDPSNSSGRLTAAAAGGMSANGLGQVGGEQAHVLTVNELAQHAHSIVDPGHIHTTNNVVGSAAGSGTLSGGGSAGTTNLASTSSVTGITVNVAGSNASHNNVPPAIAFSCIVKT